MRPRHLVITALLWSLPESVAAQETTELVSFRPGQWGAQFSVESPFHGAGAILFTSPTTAWTLDVSAAFSSSTDDRTGLPDVNRRTIAGSLDLGRRYYHTPRGRVAGFFGFGITGTYSYSRQKEATVVYSSHAWGGGVFGELGAQVHVTPYLSLGAAWPIRVQVSRTTQESVGGNFKGTDWNVSAGTLRLRGGLYF